MAIGKRLLILTEAGEGIGFGHYSRCSAIKSYFEENGALVKMFLHVEGKQNTAFPGTIRKDWLAEIDNLDERAFPVVLVDSYKAPQAIFSVLKKHFTRVIALDDYGRFAHGPHLIINPNIYGAYITYDSLAIGGSDYVILRSAFRKEHKKNELKAEPLKLLITVGGSDFRKLLPLLITVGLRLKLKMDVIAGNEDYSKQLKADFGAPSITHYGFVDEYEMKNLMLDCDIAISACGQTLHELAWLGVPTIGICIGEDQVLNMQEYISRRFLNREIFWNDPELASVLIKVMSAMQDLSERMERAARGKEIVSNKGLNNIYHEIFR